MKELFDILSHFRYREAVKINCFSSVSITIHYRINPSTTSRLDTIAERMSERTQMCNSSMEKSQKTSNDICNHVSSLPDHLVGEILSHLPTKDAVRTSVLSKQWKDKWTFIYNVDIDAREFFHIHPRDNDDIFVKFVKRILHNVPEIRSFHLKISECGDFVQNHFTTWISAVAGPKIESLQMGTIPKDIEHVQSSLLNCDSLKNLKLKIPCTFKIGVNNFACLLRLKLGYVTILNEDTNSDTMTLTFPVLKEIDLDLCEWSQVKFVEIYAPSLTIFKSLAPYVAHSQLNNYIIKIIGAMLEELVMMALGTPENIELAGTTVVCASLECAEPNPKEFEDDEDEFEEFGSHARVLLGQLSRVQNMVLSGFLEVIAYTKQGGLPLPWFMALEKLCLSYSIDGDGLLELLHATPSLKHLEIILISDRNEYNYDVVESVPSCLVSKLDKLKLDYSVCIEEPKCDIAKFLLTNGIQLKNVCVRGSLKFPTSVIVQKLRALGVFDIWISKLTNF